MNSESSNTGIPTVAQLHEARLKRWHQTGEALLTVENLRSWINAAGIVLFAPRPQIVAPAPTLVEAVLGAPNGEPTLQSIGEARTLLGRLVAEGVALPLNLMGTHGSPGDAPDFVVSAAVFSYIFTLRGDKAWKQPPANSGPSKVSNLALAAYEVLSSNGPISAYDLATQLGKEVTETACLRALNELWTHLRVLPLIQPDGKATLWELTSARFTKQIKAGANAGQPTALSALISLYLGQAVSASEDEIESFLSPLAARSRIREVAHALLAARQLDTLVAEGKTLLHVAGEAPSFIVAEPAGVTVESSGEVAETESGAESEDGSRIKKYVPRPRKIGTGYLAKGKPAAGKRPFERGESRGRSEGFKPRAGGQNERERRPFRKPTEGGPERPSFRKPTDGGPERRSFRKPTEGTPERRFDKPWEEDRPRRSAEGGFKGPRKRPFERKEQGSERREFRSSPRPPRRDEGSAERGPRRQGEGGFESRPRRESAGGFERRPRRENDGGFERRPRKDSGAGPAARPFQKRPERRDHDTRPPRKADAGRQPREAGARQERPAFRRFDAPRGEGRPPRPRREGEGSEGRSRAGEFERRSLGSKGGSEGRPPRREGGFEGRPAKKQGEGNRPFSKSSSGKPKFGGAGGKFSKPPFKKKPYAKKPSDRGPRPRRDDSA